jgi:hypothetical protein
MLRVEMREADKRLLAFGPDITREGRVQALEAELLAESSEDEGGSDGGGPMIPPSRKETGMGGSGEADSSAASLEAKDRALDRDRRRGIGEVGGSGFSVKRARMFRVVVGEIALRSM